jgi:hypothetical protein
MTPTSILLPYVPPEVKALAAELGVGECLPKVLGLARRLFPTEPMSVTVYWDHDVGEKQCILIEVLVPAEADFASDVRPRQEAFNRELIDVCPATFTHAFGLSTAVL